MKRFIHFVFLNCYEIKRHQGETGERNIDIGGIELFGYTMEDVITLKYFQFLRNEHSFSKKLEKQKEIIQANTNGKIRFTSKKDKTIRN